ncbi:unnamed protein product, partial [Mesorhabditis spiculigera]
MNVNVVAHAALIEILRPVLARDHRVLLMGSCCSHACLATNRIKTDSSFLYDAHGPYQAYAFSKLLLAVYGEMHAQSMHITHPGATLCVVHPGVVPSALYRKTNPLTRLAIGYMLPLIARSAEDAAILSLHTAFREDVKSGLYFEDGQPTSVGRDLEKATKMAMLLPTTGGTIRLLLAEDWVAKRQNTARLYVLLQKKCQVASELDGAYLAYSAALTKFGCKTGIWAIKNKAPKQMPEFISAVQPELAAAAPPAEQPPPTSPELWASTPGGQDDLACPLALETLVAYQKKEAKEHLDRVGGPIFF